MESLDSATVTIVLKIQEIVIIIMSVNMDYHVDQTIVQVPLVLTL